MKAVLFSKGGPPPSFPASRRPGIGGMDPRGRRNSKPLLSASDLISRARGLREIGRPKDAIGHYLRALELEPLSIDALHEAPEIIFNTPRSPGLQDIIGHLKNASKFLKDDLQVRSDLGYAYFLCGEHDTAAREFESILKMDAAKSDPVFHSMMISNLAFCLSKGGFSGKAMELFRKAIEIDPKNIDAKIRLAELMGMQDLPGSITAIKTLSQLISEGKEEVTIRSTLGKVFLNARRFGEAKEQFLKCIELEPGKAHHYANLASLYTHEKMNFRAALYYLRAFWLHDDRKRANDCAVNAVAAIMVGLKLVKERDRIRS